MNVVVATRGSKLSLIQAKALITALKSHADVKPKLKIVKTTGDMHRNTPLHEIGGKGLFEKEVDLAVARGDADIAVHSLKDVPSRVPENIQLTAVLPRESPLDALISKSHLKLRDLPSSSVIGTSSSRRRAALLHLRPDLRVEPIRGNLDTRLRKLETQHYDAIVVAEAGLKRLGLGGVVDEVFGEDEIVPAPCQGAIGVFTRVDDGEITRLVGRVNHETSMLEVSMEREFLRIVGGGCYVPVGVLARARNGGVEMISALYSSDGSKRVSVREIGTEDEALEVARRTAETVLEEGGSILTSLGVSR